MKIIDTVTKAVCPQGSAVALGSFDGIHMGHKALIGGMVEHAKEQGLTPVVFTFSNHPRELVPNAPRVKNILYKNEKEQIIASLGVEVLASVPFDQHMMTLPPERFVREILVEGLNAKAVFCGFNYRFGYRAQGNPERLREFGEQFGFRVSVLEPVVINGNVVSSSMIRTMIAAGQVERCPLYMGRYYATSGQVVVGNRLGRTLGFPTVNLVIDPDMVTPPNGVYVTNCIYDGVRYPSVTNVGVKPTIGEYQKNIETHIFGFDREIYGERVTVEFLKKMRDEVKFDDREELAAQILRDCREAKEFHERYAQTIEA